MSPSPPADSRTDSLGGLLFVVLWSSGYIAVDFGLRGGGPFTLAVLRFFGAGAIIGLWLLARPAARVERRALMHAAIAGILLQGGFFAFTYTGMRMGVPAAAAGLIAGLMPLVTTLGAALLLGERMTRWTLPGLVIGLAGVLLVIGPALFVPASLLGYGLMACALLSLSGGTLYQKRHNTALDARLPLLAQLLASGVVLLPIALTNEGLAFDPRLAAVGGLLWIILVNACAGLLLYLWLLNRGAAARVAGLFYLVPPVTAVMAAVTLGTAFGAREAAGFALAALGVWIGLRRG
jgi:drug/metabolite transporter (DMT)-like permease